MVLVVFVEMICSGVESGKDFEGQIASIENGKLSSGLVHYSW